MMSRDTSQRLGSDMRKWAKKIIVHQLRKVADAGKILPLVESGDLRGKYAIKANARAIATATRSRLTVTIPRGDRQSKRVNDILSKLPQWEFDYIVRQFREGMKAHLAGKLTALPANRGGVVRGGTTATRTIGGTGPTTRQRGIRGHVERRI